jgi:hypothetical protein
LSICTIILLRSMFSLNSFCSIAPKAAPLHVLCHEAPRTCGMRKRGINEWYHKVNYIYYSTLWKIDSVYCHCYYHISQTTRTPITWTGLNALSNQSIKELRMMRSGLPRDIRYGGLPRATYPGIGKCLMGLSQEMVRCVCK